MSRSRGKNPLDSKSKNMLVVGAVAAGGFLLYLFSKSATASAANAATSLAPGAAGGGVDLTSIGLPAGLYTGAVGSSPSGSTPIYQSTLPAPTVSQVAGQSAIWSNLQPTTPLGSSGYVNFPSGSQAAVALLPWRTDGVNFYTNWAGVVFAVPPATDQMGNYTAIAA